MAESKTKNNSKSNIKLKVDFQQEVEALLVVIIHGAKKDKLVKSTNIMTKESSSTLTTMIHKLAPTHVTDSQSQSTCLISRTLSFQHQNPRFI